MFLSLQTDMKLALDDTWRGSWLIRTSALTEQEISGSRLITQRQYRTV